MTTGEKIAKLHSASFKHLIITLNQHLAYCEPMQDYMSDRDFHFVSDEDKQKCIDEGLLWEVQWYPRTQVCFLLVAASSLDTALDFLLSCYEEEVQN